MCTANATCFLLNKYLSELSITAYTALIKPFNALAGILQWIIKLYGTLNYTLKNKNTNM
jgi:hypothetical protein